MTKTNPPKPAPRRREQDPISRRYRPRLDEYEPLEHWWDAYVEVWNLIRPAWWPILVTAVMMVLVLAVGQIQDVLAAMPVSLGAQMEATGISGRFWTTLISCAAFSLFAWAFARGLLAVRFPYTPCPMDPPDWHVSLRFLISRALGLAMPISMAVAYFDLEMRTEGWIYVGLSGILLLIYAYVKPFLKDWIYTPEDMAADREQAIADADSALEEAEDVLDDVNAEADSSRQRYLLARVATLARDAGEKMKEAGETFADVSLYDRAMPSYFPRQMNILLYAILILHIIIAALVIWSKVIIPQWIGAAAILFLSAGGWMAFGVFLFSYWPRFSRLPSGILIFSIWMGFASLFNHNHDLRLLDAPLGIADDAPRLEAYTNDWLAARQAYLPQADDNRIFPVLVVAAEGGGARAAYWTGKALDGLSQVESAFGLPGHDHIFAVSAVSGGSLGTAAWGATLKTKTAEERSQALDQFLRQDFLSPVTAGAMYVDLPSDMLPFPVEAFDRANWLETSFERGFARLKADQNPFVQDFRQLWDASRPLGALGSVPLLVYNTTAVRTGRVWQVSPVRISDDFDPHCHSGDFVDLINGLDKGISLSAAVHLSARFTGVSPAGHLSLKAHKTCGDMKAERFVDGAYFENSGADTATRIIRQMDWQIENYCRPYEQPERCDPDKIVVFPVAILTQVPPAADAPNFMHETLSVIATVANTRVARGQDALRRMGDEYGGVLYTIELPAKWLRRDEPLGCTLRTDEGGVAEPTNVTRDVPLGWTLSKAAADHMCREAKRSMGLDYLKLIIQTGG
jgi:hypothetical protein